MYTPYDVLIDNISCVRKGFYPVRRPSIPSPKKKYIQHDIMGADGSLYVDTGNYEDINLEIDFNYLINPSLWSEAFRLAKRIMLSASELRLTDDQNVFYKIKKVEIGQNQRVTRRIGKFTATFTLDPYSYFVNGRLPVSVINNQIYNQYDESMPVYTLTGSGNGTLTVNGKNVSFNRSVTIDCSKKRVLVNDEVVNTAISGRYEDITLKYGINTIEVTGNYTLTVVPNWRQI